MGKKEGDIDPNEVPEFPGAKSELYPTIKERLDDVEIPDLPDPNKESVSGAIPGEMDGIEEEVPDAKESSPENLPGPEDDTAPGEMEGVKEAVPDSKDSVPDNVVAKKEYLDDLKVQLKGRLDEMNSKKAKEPFITHRSLKELNDELDEVNKELSNIHI